MVELGAPLLQPGFTGLDPWHRPTLLESHAVEASHKQSGGRLAQMLVSSGLIFLSKKKEKRKEKEKVLRTLATVVNVFAVGLLPINPKAPCLKLPN